MMIKRFISFHTKPSVSLLTILVAILIGIPIGHILLRYYEDSLYSDECNEHYSKHNTFENTHSGDAFRGWRLCFIEDNNFISRYRSKLYAQMYMYSIVELLNSPRPEAEIVEDYHYDDLKQCIDLDE